MNEFNFETLASLTTRVKVGFVGSINDFYCESEVGVPIVRTTDIDNIDFDKVKYVTSEFHIKNKKSQLKKGDLIIARHGENGKAVIYEHDREAQVLNAVIIEPDQNKISSELLKIFFDSPFIKKQISGSVKGSVQGVINTKHVADLVLNIGENIDYEFMTNTITNISKKIELNNKINAELEVMAKLIYDYWFVQLDFPDTNGKPYKSSGGKMVYNEALKHEIPDGWDDGCCSSLFNFNPTLSIKKGTISSHIDMNALPTSGFMTKQVKAKSFSGGMKFQNGDIVLARITPCLENGKTGLISLLGENEVGFGSTEFIVLRGKFFYLRCFGACLARSDMFRKHAISKMTGTSGRKRVNYSTLASYKMPIPDEELLKIFEKIINPFFERMTTNTKENEELSKLRNWLLPMLMNGQVTVKDSA